MEKPNKSGIRVVFGADHGGFEMKNQLCAYAKDLGYQAIDYGVYSTDAVDYPDVAFLVASAVARGDATLGVIVDGAGIGSAIVANKVPGIRAGSCNDITMARNSREHNNCNVLTLGSGIIGLSKAKQILQAWLETDYAGGRHQKRIDKILDYEKRFLDRTILFESSAKRPE